MADITFLLVKNPSPEKVAPFAEQLNKLGKRFTAFLEADPQDELTSRLQDYNAAVIAIENSRVIGYSLLSTNSTATRWLLSATFVDEPRRKQGIGGSMVSMLMNEAYRQGAKTIEATVSIDSEESMGRILQQRGFHSSLNGMEGDYFKYLER